MKYPLLWGAALPLAAALIFIPLSASLLPAPASQAALSSPAPAASATPPAASAPAAAPSATPAPAGSATPPASMPEQKPSPAATQPAANANMAAYAEQPRQVIDQSATPRYATDASYQIGSIAQDTPPLAPGEHVGLVQNTCSVCHATTFITSQPPLPESVWHDEVYKMKEKYGATFISDENAEKIIAYLAAHYTPDTRKPDY